LNNSGQVTGFFYIVTFQQAFIGDASGLNLIPLPLGATFSYGASINDQGVVAGFSDVGDWIWDPIKGVRLLDDLVPGAGFIANGPAIINNQGQILDQIQGVGYVLLTPTPEPSSVGLSATGLILLALSARRIGRYPKRRFGTGFRPD
jgi:hypothetical protein